MWVNWQPRGYHAGEVTHWWSGWPSQFSSTFNHTCQCAAQVRETVLESLAQAIRQRNTTMQPPPLACEMEHMPGPTPPRCFTHSVVRRTKIVISSSNCILGSFVVTQQQLTAGLKDTVSWNCDSSLVGVQILQPVRVEKTEGRTET